jgi:hypothetical protein
LKGEIYILSVIKLFGKIIEEEVTAEIGGKKNMSGKKTNVHMRVPKEKIEILYHMAEEFRIEFTVSAHYIYYSSGSGLLIVTGEVFGRELEKDIEIVVTAYSEAGEIFDTLRTTVYAAKFKGMHSFRVCIDMIENEEIGKIKIYPVRY